MKNLTKEMIDSKLKQIAIHEEKFGECTTTRAMKKYCLNYDYRNRVHAFNNATMNTLNSPSSLYLKKDTQWK